MYFAEGRCSIFRDKNRSPCMWYDSMLFVEKMNFKVVNGIVINLNHE